VKTWRKSRNLIGQENDEIQGNFMQLSAEMFAPLAYENLYCYTGAVSIPL